MFGLVWAPFAGLVCARAARARGLNPWRYAIVGAVYSALFFLPWIYLLSKIRAKPLRGHTIATGYLFVYGLWLFGPIAEMCIFSSPSFSAGGPVPEPTPGPEVTSVLVGVMWAMVAISLLCMGVAKLCIRGTDVHSWGRQLAVLQVAIAGLLPFVCIYVCLLIVWLVGAEASPLT